MKLCDPPEAGVTEWDDFPCYVDVSLYVCRAQDTSAASSVVNLDNYMWVEIRFDAQACRKTTHDISVVSMNSEVEKRTEETISTLLIGN